MLSAPRHLTAPDMRELLHIAWRVILRVWHAQVGEALLELEAEDEAAQQSGAASSADAGSPAEHPIASSAGSAEEGASDSSTLTQVCSTGPLRATARLPRPVTWGTVLSRSHMDIALSEISLILKTNSKPRTFCAPSVPIEPQRLLVSRMQEGGKALASPAVRRMAREYGLDLASIAGSGPDGRVTKGHRPPSAVSRHALPCQHMASRWSLTQVPCSSCVARAAWGSF
jgi:pyruvate/2-oxoglutarate dehydrogenase complex dihydrolipoamide acyltransferase (E2) component